MRLQTKQNRLRMNSNLWRPTKLPLEQKKESAKTKLGQAQTILRQANTDITKTERTIAAEKKSIAQLEQEIAKKQAELNQAETDAQRDARLSLKRHQDLLKRLQEDAPRKLKALETLQAQGQVIDREVDDLVVKKGSVEQNIRNIEDRIKRLREQSGDRLNLFGTGLDRVRQAIDHPRQPWKGGKPIGPLGMYVNLEDPMYRKVACSVLGTTLCGFAVKHPDDKVQLLSILQNVREYKPGSGSNTKSIITYSGDRFDYSRGSLNHLAPTLLSKLRIEDEDVLRILVNQHRIERLFVAPSVKVANEKTDEMMARGLPGAEFVTADCYRTTANQGKGKGSTPLEDWRGSPLFSKNMAVEIADLEQKRGAEVASVEQYDRDFKDAKARQNAKRTEIADMQKEHSRARVGIQSAEKTIHRLESQIEERPDDAIGGLEMARQEHERVLKAREDDLKSFQADLPGYEETIQKLSNEFEDLGRQIAEFIPETQKRQDAVNIVKEAQTKARNEMRQHRESHANFRTRLQEREDDRDRAAAELKDWEVQAQRIEGDRVNSRRTIEQIKKEKEATEKARIEAEKRQGVSLEEIMPRYQKAKDELAELKRQLANFRSVANQVKQMFRTRMRWWELQRNSIAIRARTLFIVNLHKRNLEGKLLFEHKKKKLGVRIQTTGITKKRDAGGAEEARFKVPKNLSGGERSFSTVSLLLSLWDTASCPIRCLDEWDVFLDAGNRGVAAKMLVEGAKESQGKQFILITPLDLHGVKCDGPGNKQIRLDDPVRNQATLSFAPQTAD
ncbi:hypothetical protein BD324DRAFT_440475 [Kockovaella imperatae]|uniref:RecF/RecN/SMC N-terminal domain-containing protein n=1 Tax=Kockovaella imperatae TaxID=4999 RepID=A0A1Y1UH11_9TREE|nr:hypothetical protein BD324DRAFT_440475 [Kockovaella imperatae]ORX37312.1 hypothetical protein BD324DRAFT_440475 [Kockovaella imperatae]